MNTSPFSIRFFRYHVAAFALLLGFAGYQFRHTLFLKGDAYEEEETDSPEVPVDQYNRLTADPTTGRIPTEALAEARQFVQDYISSNGANHPQAPNMGGFGGVGSATLTGLNWHELGPTQIGGRTRALLVDKNDATGNTVWAGSVGGGLWKTTNGGQSWVRINDFFDNLAVSCLVQHPTNPQIMYFGTSEGWFNLDAIKGEGIWRTTDGGVNWVKLGNSFSGLPGNNVALEYVQQLAVASNGDLYSATRNYGLLRLEGGGANSTKQWQRLDLPTMAGSGPEIPVPGAPKNDPIFLNNATAVEIAPNGDIFVGLHSYDATSKYLGTYYYSGPYFGSAVYKYVPGTGQCTQLTGIPSSGTNGYHSDHERYTITIGPKVAGGSTYTVYIVTSKHSPSNYTVPLTYYSSQLVQGMYRSTDGGTSWTSCVVPIDGNNVSFAGYQAWYNLMLKVSPANGNFLYCGGIDLYQSNDGGQNWGKVTKSGTGSGYPSATHTDWHVAAFPYNFPTNPKAYFGGDGGVYLSSNANIVATGTSGPTFSARNKGYNTVQFYSVGAALPSNSLMGGTQDNHTRNWSVLNIQPTTEINTGDGGYCFVDSDNPNFRIASSFYNNWYATFTAYTGSFGTAWLTRSNDGPGVNPADYDDVNNALYSAGPHGSYYRYNNFQYINQVISHSRQLFTLPAPYNTDYVTHIRVSPNNPSTLYVTVKNSQNNRPVVLKILNANTIAAGIVTVQNLSGINFPSGGNISCLEIETGNEDHAVATLYNYGAQGFHFSNIWETANFTSATPTWTSCDGQTGGLKNIPVRWALFNPANADELLIATEVGVWSTTDLNGTNTAWFPATNGLANVRTDMLFLRSSDKMVFAATHGRGMFWTDVFCSNQANFTTSKNNPCINETITFTATSSGVTNPSYSWDLNSDGIIDNTGASVTVCNYGSDVTLLVNGSNLSNAITIVKPSFIKFKNCHAVPCGGGGGGSSSASSVGGGLDSIASRPVGSGANTGLISVTVRPNPVADICYFDLTLKDEMVISADLISPSGQKIRTVLNPETVSLGSHSRSFPVSSLPAGRYILQVQANGEWIRKAVIVSH